MPAKAPNITPALVEKAGLLGREIRERRKVLGVSAASAAESAGMSRVTWHRIEKGELSVTLGAYLAAADVLGLSLSMDGLLQGDADSKPSSGADGLPLRIDLADFPQLRRLAWQVQGSDFLTPREALSFYERNWRHVNEEELDPRESRLIEALREVFKGDAGVV